MFDARVRRVAWIIWVKFKNGHTRYALKSKKTGVLCEDPLLFCAFLGREYMCVGAYAKIRVSKKEERGEMGKTAYLANRIFEKRRRKRGRNKIRQKLGGGEEMAKTPFDKSTKTARKKRMG